MKKVLFATTALVMTAGVAAAESHSTSGVAVSGSARMGVQYDGTDAVFSSRVRVVFTMTGETDGGLSFGASMRADQTGGNGLTSIATPGLDNVFGTPDDGSVTIGSSGTSNTDSTVFISGAFGKLTMGDNDSAANALVGHVSGVGYTGLGDWNELRYLGQTDTSVLYEYSTGALSFAVSSSQANAADEAVSAAVKYAGSNFTVALGVEDTVLATHTALGASATFGAATVKAVVSDTDIVGDDTQFALSLDYTTGATVVTLFATDEGSFNNIGIGATYDLGGGAKVAGGIVSVGDPSVDDTIAEVGLTFAF